MVGTLSHNQKIAGSIPSEGAYLGFGFHPWFWVHVNPGLGAYEGFQLMSLSATDVSLYLLLSPEAMKKLLLGEDFKNAVLLTTSIRSCLCLSREEKKVAI